MSLAPAKTRTGHVQSRTSDFAVHAIEAELKVANPPAAPTESRQKPKRVPLPPQLSRTVIAGSLRSGKRAAAIISLIQSARMNEHDAYVYLKGVADTASGTAGE